MFDSLRKFIDILFKSLGIVVIVISLVFVVVMFKSCSDTFEMMDKVNKEVKNDK